MNTIGAENYKEKKKSEVNRGKITDFDNSIGNRKKKNLKDQSAEKSSGENLGE